MIPTLIIFILQFECSSIFNFLFCEIYVSIMKLHALTFYSKKILLSQGRETYNTKIDNTKNPTS